MDRLVKLLSPRTRIRVTFADITQTAKALEARHMCGPVAGRILAEGLATAAILSTDSTPEEAVMLQAKVDGPIRGVVVEATGEGHLRGYTYEKVLNDVDGDLPVVSQAGLGASGNVMIQKSLPGRLLAQTPMPFTPADFKVLLARYYNQSMQVPAGVEMAVQADSGGILFARVLVAERMPDASPASFLPVLEALQDGRVRAAMEKEMTPAAVAEVTGLDDLADRGGRDLMFRCRCSREKAIRSFSSMSATEIDDLVKAGKSQHVVCHMCGADYRINPSEVAR